MEQLKKQVYQLEVCFSNKGPSQELLKEPCWMKTYQVGNLYYFIAYGDEEVTRQLLKADGAEYIEKQILSLEEIFAYMNPLHSVEQGGYVYESL